MTKELQLRMAEWHQSMAQKSADAQRKYAMAMAKKKTDMAITWTPTRGCPLNTEVAFTAALGEMRPDCGYIYNDERNRWVAVYIYEDGSEIEQSYTSRLKAKQYVQGELDDEC